MPRGSHIFLTHTDDASKKFLELVDILHFFCLKTYYGIPISSYETAAQNIGDMLSKAISTVQNEYMTKSKERIDRKIANYFNFSDFDSTQFKNILDNFIKNENKHSISIDEALTLAKKAPQSIYIVIFKKNEKVCNICKTEHPLTYIGTHYRANDADSVWFDPVEGTYADDLKIALMIFYDLPLANIRTGVYNRKYTTVRQAIFVYKKTLSIPKKDVLSAIEHGKLRVIEAGNGQELIDKIELNTAIRYHLLKFNR